MSNTRIALLVILLALAAGSCGGPAGTGVRTEPAAVTEPPPSAPAPLSWTDSVLASMSVEEKVGQLFVVWTTSHYMPGDSRRWNELMRYAAERKVGGFYFSLGGIYEFPVHANKLQAAAKTPLLITVDFEWGAGMRIGQGTTFPRAMALGATRDTALAYRMGLAVAAEARALGVHQNYSPVADVNNNPKNPVINTRSFGEDPLLVSAMARAFLRGEQEGGLIATVKHFPGHGDTDIDTHLDLPSVHYDRARLDSVELLPFRDAIRAGVMSVMSAHIHADAFESSDSVPATVSSAVLTTLLRGELGFGGLVVTDALAMQGITKLFTPGEAAKRAFLAGADVLLMSPDTDEAIDSLVAAVRRGAVTMERLDRSVRRILEHKRWAGLDRKRTVEIDSVQWAVGTEAPKSLAREIARRSVTVLGNAGGLLPLRNLNGSKLLMVVFSDDEDPDGNRELYRELRERAKMELAILDPRSNAMEYDEALKKVKKADLVIAQFVYQMRSGTMTGFLPKEVTGFLRKVDSMKKKVVAISTANPYVVMDIPVPEAVVLTYSTSAASEAACAEVLFGEVPAQGRLPITIPGRGAYGDGVRYDALGVRTGTPAEAGFDAQRLKRVDSIMTQAVADSAFPGGVLLVAKDGIVVHEQAYGRHTYEPGARPVRTDDIFDMASVTKVLSTTSAMMRLVEEGRLSLNDPVAKYLPAFAQNGKERITLYNLMVHNSGLQAWRKYYEFCGEPKCVLDSIFAAPLVYPTGDSTVYSDLGLITVGKVIEKVTGMALDRYVDSVFFRPLGMRTTMYNPPSSLMERIIPTEVDSVWKRTNVAVHGRVHDENAATLGGVSGHAGLFSTASDVVKMLQMELNGGTYGGRRYLAPETIARFTAQQSERSSRGIGWDTRADGRSFTGQYFSPKTFLHTGFTGTSVAADPERKLIVVLLTNRVHPTRNNNKLSRVRPAVHDAVVEALIQR
ncbi:MAG: serine hydrolase [Bacteroidetes bacterium]|nr:MAG: serine hydrolase [Bacteroidota bacterium]